MNFFTMNTNPNTNTEVSATIESADKATLTIDSAVALLKSWGLPTAAAELAANAGGGTTDLPRLTKTDDGRDALRVDSRDQSTVLLIPKGDADGPLTDWVTGDWPEEIGGQAPPDARHEHHCNKHHGLPNRLSGSD